MAAFELKFEFMTRVSFLLFLFFNEIVNIENGNQNSEQYVKYVIFIYYFYFIGTNKFKYLLKLFIK